MGALARAHFEKGLPLAAGAPIAITFMAVAAQASGSTIATVFGVVIFVLGFAHGAGDENVGTIRPFRVAELAAYIVVGAGFAALFVMAAEIAITLFFALSAWHFSQEHSGFGRVTRLAIAALAVGGSALFRPETTAWVIATLVGSTVPDVLMVALAVVGVAGSMFAGVSVVQRDTGWQHAAVCLLAAIVFDPVLAVAYIFLIGHAWPIQRAQILRYGLMPTVRAECWPTLAAAAGAVLLVTAVIAGIVPLAIAIALAIGMAVPHMLVERIEP